MQSMMDHILHKQSHKREAKQDVTAALMTFSELNLETAIYTGDGKAEHLASLTGTIPVTKKGLTHSIPIRIWLMETHPFDPPMIFVISTENMRVRIGTHVDGTGLVFLQYFETWNYPKTNLVTLIREAIRCFEQELPVVFVQSSCRPPPLPLPINRSTSPEATGINVNIMSPKFNDVPMNGQTTEPLSDKNSKTMAVILRHIQALEYLHQELNRLNVSYPRSSDSNIEKAARFRNILDGLYTEVQCAAQFLTTEASQYPEEEVGMIVEQIASRFRVRLSVQSNTTGHRILPSASSSPSPSASGVAYQLQLLRDNWDWVTEHINAVPVADCMFRNGALTDEQLNSIRALSISRLSSQSSAASANTLLNIIAQQQQQQLPRLFETFMAALIETNHGKVFTALTGAGISNAPELINSDYVTIESEEFEGSLPVTETAALHHSWKAEKPIIGFTIMNNNLFVLFDDRNDISVYDVSSYKLNRRQPVLDLEAARDMTSCAKLNCIYISSRRRKSVYKVDVSSTPIKWAVDDYPEGLSVNQESNILVAFPEARKVVEYTENGIEVRKIELLPDISYPMHACELSRGFVVVTSRCVGSSYDKVCLVSLNGDILHTSYGTPNMQFKSAVRLAVDRTVFVVDSGNRRVVQLGRYLKAVSEIATDLKDPSRLFYQAANNRLYIADNDYLKDLCNLHVYEIREY